MNIIRFDKVSKAFGGNQILEQLDFSVERSEVYGLLGPNGCGKSTAINILCNLLDPDTGHVRIGEAEIANAARIFGYCPQEISLYRDLSPAENLYFFAQVYGMSRPATEQRVAELIHLFRLEHYAQTPVGSLSGGWQRRVSIAVSLIHEPDVVILDEPTSAVDLEARQELWQLIETLSDNGTTILLTTHHLDEAQRLCSRIGIMQQGRIAREGTIPELLTLVPGKMVAMIDTPHTGAISRRAAELGWQVRYYAGRIACLLPIEVSLKEVVDALADIKVLAVSLQPVSLEHAYLEVTQRATQ